MKGDQNRRTPLWLFKLLERDVAKEKFVLDAAASRENALCRRYFDEQKNGLEQPWVNGTFNNPPFKRFGEWAEKAYEEARILNGLVVQVGPTGCSQSWFHQYARFGTIYVPDERISFMDSATGEPTSGGDRDTMIYVYGPGFWNKGPGFKILPLPVRGLVIRAAKAVAA